VDVPAPPQRAIRREVLPNGLVLLLDESHLAAVAEVQIWAQVGSADEGPGEAGIAHFHEHMLFKGTARRGVAEVAGAIEGAGGRVNAYTSYDTTVYHATVPSDGGSASASTCWRTWCAARCSTRTSWRREIEVVLEEIRRSDDSPPHVLRRGAVRRRLPGASLPLADPRLAGERRQLRPRAGARLLPPLVRARQPGGGRVRGLRGRRAVGGGAGAVRRGLAPAGARRARPAEPLQDAPRAALLRALRARLLRDRWPAVALAHPDTPYLDLLAFVLGEGESSRLVRRVKEAEGLVDRVDASCYTPLDPGLFGVSADLDAERVADAVEAIAREVEAVRAAPVSDEELEKARINFLASEHFERESVAGRARKLGTFEAIAGDWRCDAAYLESVRRATPDDLLRVARAHLDPRRVTVAAVLPEGAESALDEKALLAAAGRGAERAVRAAVPERIGAGLAPTAAAVIASAAPARASSFGPAIESYRLANGAVLHVEPRREVPVVALRGAFHGGLLAEDAETVGLTQLVTSMWLRGTRRRDAAELAHAIESIAADVDGFAGRSGFGLSMEATSDRFEAALDLFAEVLLEPAFAADELERERRDTLAALARREDRLGARVLDLFTGALWAAHPYRWPVLGTPRTVASFTRADVRAHHARWVRGPNLVLALSGDVDPDRAAEQIASRLAGLDATPCPRPAPPVEPPLAAPCQVELHKDRAQAHLVVGFRGLTVDDPDRFALEVITQLLAGQGGRLFLELRDRRGLAYSVSALNAEGVAPGFFAVTIGTAPDKLDEARRGIHEELAALVAAAPSEEDLARARRYLIGNFEIDRQRSAVRAAHMAIDALYGLGADAQRRFAANVAAVTADDVLRVARRVIDLPRAVEAVIRP
jgi:zinc protease